MTRKLNLLFIAVAMAGILVSCDDNAESEYTELDRTWDASDSAFMADYNATRAENERLEQEFQARSASADSASAAQYAEAQRRLAANRQALQEMDAKRAEARAAREAARTANDRAAYDNARTTSDYTTWQTELNRIRAEQKELEGTIQVGSKTVGTVDANVQDTSKPLLRVEPGKEDEKPLIEMNKNK